jgi:hypothetical protein
MICGGLVEQIRYILYIDPQRYDRLSSEAKKSLGRLVGQINRHPAVQGNKIMMMGPGRWGSGNIELGVNATYADIDNAAVLVEVALEEAGHVPEVSYGTHFFQDLVEGQIIYLPVYPDDPESDFNAQFFVKSPNSLKKLLPEAQKYGKIIKLIDVQAFTKSKSAHLIANPGGRKAILFLRNGKLESQLTFSSLTRSPTVWPMLWWTWDFAKGTGPFFSCPRAWTRWCFILVSRRSGPSL